MSEPDVTTVPALGNIALLGELYDENTSSFLGVLLYTPDSIQKVIKVVPRDPPNTDLQVYASNSYTDKASTIDIGGSLSLEILSGLISVSGSASYLHDVKANTSQDSFAMTLKMLGREERIEVGSSDLVAMTDNLNDSYAKATHYVSAIQYGGNAVISMVEITSQLTDDEKAAGSMQVTLNDLGGKVNLTGSVDLDAVSEYSSLDGKFEIHMYGDFTIADVPINAKDALTALPEVYSSLKDAGVPVSVTLQPIPDGLKSDAALIHSLDAQQITDLLNAYSSLDDLNNRFMVLENSVERYRDLVPYLTSAIADARNAFSGKRVDVIQSLKVLLTTVVDRSSSSTDDGNSTDTSSDTEDEDAVEALLDTVNAIISENELQGSDKKITPPNYPTSLGGLEKAFARFEALNYVLKAQNASLTSLTPLSGKLSIASQAMVFLSWSVSATAFANFSNLITTGFGMYSQNFICYFVYTEDASEINDTKLPIDKDALSWTNISWDGMQADSTSAAYTSQNSKEIYVMPIGKIEVSSANSSDSYAYTWWDLGGLLGISDYKHSYAVLVKAQATSLTDGSILFFLGDILDSSPQFYCAIRGQQTVDFEIYDSNKSSFYSLSGSTTVSVNAYADFEIAFVQDATAGQWLLYVNGDQQASMTIPSGFSFRTNSTTWTFCCVAGRKISDATYNSWNGTIKNCEFYADALSQTQVQDRYNKTCL